MLVVVALLAGWARHADTGPTLLTAHLHRWTYVGDAWHAAVATADRVYGIEYVSPRRVMVLTRPVPFADGSVARFALELFTWRCDRLRRRSLCSLQRPHVGVVTLVLRGGYRVPDREIPPYVRRLGEQLTADIQNAIDTL